MLGFGLYYSPPVTNMPANPRKQPSREANSRTAKRLASFAAADREWNTERCRA